MPVTAFHQLTATTPDDPAYEIRPSHNNQSHLVTLNISATEISGLFSNANGVSFGLSESSITASIAAGVPSPVNFSAGTTSSDLGSVVFSNSNGISFGLNGSTITGSHNALTTAMASNRGSDFVQATAAFAGTSASGTIASGGISVSIGPYITTAMLSNAATISNIKVSAGTLSANRSDITFSNSNGVSFGLETNGIITGTVKTDYLTTAALSNHSHGVSFTSGSTVFQTLSFTNSNGISFNSGTQGIFGSHNALTTAAASDHSHGNPTLALTNLTGTTASNSAGLTLSLSAAAAGAAVINFSAGTTSSNIGSVVFSNSNGVSFGLNASTITASVAAGAVAPTISYWGNSPIVIGTGAQVSATATATSDGTFWLVPMQDGGALFPGNMTASTFGIAVSGASSSNYTAAQSLRFSLGIYTLVNATQLSRVFSASTSYTDAATSQSSLVHGLRWLTIHSSQFNVQPTFSQTSYWAGIWARSSGASRAVSWMALQLGNTGPAYSGPLGAASASANTFADDGLPFHGLYSVSFTTGMPGAIARSDITHTGAGYGNRLPIMWMDNYGFRT
jgi:hypothetical protein